MAINYSNGIILVSGPVKSGKSRFAEKILMNKHDVNYLATGISDDGTKSWENRITKHRQARPSTWKTIESTNIISVIAKINSNGTLLIDSIGGFVSAYLELSDEDWSILLKNTIKAIQSFDGLVVLVAEEVGWGVCPPTAIGNLFVDRLWLTINKVDSIATQSWLVLHGRAINLSQNSIPI